jgi:V/A-type H+-transporting ATPase subunit I
MVRVRLFAHREEIDPLAGYLQDQGCFHPLPPREQTADPGGGRGPERAARAVAVLAAGQSKGMLDQFFRPRREVGKEDVDRASSPVVATLVERAIELEKRGVELRHRRDGLSGTRALALPWLGMGLSGSELASIETVGSRGIRLSPSNRRILERKVEGFDPPVVVAPFSPHEGRDTLLLLFPRSREREIDPLFEGVDAESVDLSFLTGRPDTMVREIDEAVAGMDRLLAEAEEERRGLTPERPAVELLHDIEHAAVTRRAVVAGGDRTETVVCLDGWVAARDEPALERALAQRFPTVVLQILPAGEEIPPVRLRNSAIVRPFEVVTELFGRPQPTEFDPTPLLAPFFIIFFGLCITDAAYGILLALFSWLLLRWGSTRGVDGRFFRLMLYGGVSTAILGAITGGWLGDIQNRLPAFLAPVGHLLNSLVVFSPLDQPMTFMILSLVLGFLQIQTGLAIKVIGLLRAGSTTEALLSAFPWFLLIPALCGWATASFLPAAAPFVPGFKLVAAGAAASILLYGGPGIRNPFARIGAGLYALYGASAYLGDLLSYLRLVALGLSTGVIGMVVNLLAGMLAGLGVIGWVPALILLVAGHSFNLAINLLGAYIHTSRLQYVEFFPKFFHGGGTPFSPLAYNGRFTTQRIATEGGV